MEVVQVLDYRGADLDIVWMGDADLADLELMVLGGILAAFVTGMPPSTMYVSKILRRLKPRLLAVANCSHSLSEKGSR